MRRLVRWLLNALTVLSLLLWVATAGLWLRSHRWSDELDYVRADGRSAWVAAMTEGQLNVGRIVGIAPPLSDTLVEVARGHWHRSRGTATSVAQADADLDTAISRVSGGSHRHVHFAAFRWLCSDGGVYVGFGAGHGDLPLPSVRVVGFPLWLACGAFLLLPARCGVAWVHRRSARRAYVPSAATT